MEMVAISSILLHITSLATQIVAVARSGRGSRHRADTSAAQQQPDRRWVLELIQQLVIDQEASTSTATVRGSLLQAPSAWIGDMSICTNRRGPQVHMVRASLRTNSTYDNQQINWCHLRFHWMHVFNILLFLVGIKLGSVSGLMSIKQIGFSKECQYELTFCNTHAHPIGQSAGSCMCQLGMDNDGHDPIIASSREGDTHLIQWKSTLRKIPNPPWSHCQGYEINATHHHHRVVDGVSWCSLALPAS
ncbi:uncharacterized protein LOC125507886 [Triticum urartu]|uniref:uncharacterized protein LOC125507886 n=1 Tax=Triticum urartu TaxID=4572 RepID=UPI00204320E8|nr:uncharacterized protein LOC125507886 [Triticum urartu]